MNRHPLLVSGVLVCAAMATGCAQIPKSAVAETEFRSLSCEEAARQSEAAASTQAAAEQARSDSWHAIVPVVVAVRYVYAGSAAREAARRQQLLAEHSARLGCVL